MELNEKQENILKVAEALFAQKGFEGTSVRDIAKAANINVAMISYYFGSKDKLLGVLIKERGRRFAELLEGLNADQAKNSWEKMEIVIDYFVDLFLENRNFHLIANRRSSLANNKELDLILLEIKKRDGAKIVEILEEGEKRGLFRAVDNELTISSIIGTINQVASSRLFYADLLGVSAEDEPGYYALMKPKLKNHLRKMLRAHLLLSQPKKH